MPKPVERVLFIALLLSAYSVDAQQFNTDNYLTMPHGTGTFVLTTGERDATMYSTFTLLPRFELNFQSSLFWAAFGLCICLRQWQILLFLDSF